MRELFAKLFRRHAPTENDLDSEILAHIELRVDDNIAAGMTPVEAHDEARRHFGNALLTRERVREAWRFPRIDSFGQDLRYGLRGVRRSPGFALAVILTLALGIGATTAIFSVVYNVLLRPLPYPGGERLVGLGEVAGQANGISVTWINYRYWRAENRTFEEMAAMEQADFTMTGRGEAQITHGAMVTPSFFRITSAHAQLGRLFTDADDQVGAPGVAVLTWEFWNKTLASEPAALGATLMLNGKLYQVIGVLRPAARVLMSRADYYVPIGPVVGRKTSRAAHGSIGVIGLLKPGVTLSGARTNLNEIMQRLALSDPGPESSHRASASFLTESIVGDVRQTLLMLMAAVALLLLIACANVSSLLLVRGAARTREIAIRTSIGAGRARVARQLLTENLALSLFGGGLGVVIAFGYLRALIALAPKSLPRLSEVALDLPVLGFALAVTTVTAALAGLMPVLAAGRLDVASALRDGAVGSGSAVRGQRLRSALVVGEIAVTLLLSYTSAGLIRSLIAAQHADPGFDSHNLLALALQVSPAEYKTSDQVRQFYATLTDALRRQPGVFDVALVTCPPGAGDCGDWWYSPLDRSALARADVPLTLFLAADVSYFRTMGIRLLAGREFGPGDRTGSPLVTIVNENLARRWWLSPQAAIGQRIKFGGPYNEGDLVEIVGVTVNVSQMGLDGEKQPQMFFPWAQDGAVPAFLNSASVMMRTKGNPAALIPAVRRTLSSLNRNLPIRSLKPFDELLGATLARRRFSTLLLGVFAALAMALAGAGIYGVLNYWVSVRNREIAVRMALGARRPTILRWAGWQALRLALAGIALGAAGGWSAASFLKSMVYGASERSPATMLLAIVVVLAIVALAAGLPAWRATRVDVNRNLREA
jgi:putative ABC transport system permease protein